jgi:hypothetical protein
MTEAEADRLADLRAMQDVIIEHAAEDILPAGVPSWLGPHGMDAVAEYLRAQPDGVRSVQVEVVG